MKIISAEFIKSAVEFCDYPVTSFPEVAFAGRSNVGKSSLINALANRKKLAKTSNTPGVTQTINFFVINKNIGFVDLPGYGFAKVPSALRKQWQPMVETYLTRRKQLRLVVFILDARRIPGPGDMALAQWLAHHQIPALYVMTKKDKLSKNQVILQGVEVKKQLGMPKETGIIFFSAKTGDGKDMIWQELERNLSLWLM